MRSLTEHGFKFFQGLSTCWRPLAVLAAARQAAPALDANKPTHKHDTNRGAATATKNSLGQSDDQRQATSLPSSLVAVTQQVANQAVMALRATASPFVPAAETTDHMLITIELGLSCGASVTASDYSAPSSPRSSVAGSFADGRDDLELLVAKPAAPVCPELRKVGKKLARVEQLKTRQAAGVVLGEDQLAKIAQEADLRNRKSVLEGPAWQPVQSRATKSKASRRHAQLDQATRAGRAQASRSVHTATHRARRPARSERPLVVSLQALVVEKPLKARKDGKACSGRTDRMAWATYPWLYLQK
jgi:hypothetical protein